MTRSAAQFVLWLLSAAAVLPLPAQSVDVNSIPSPSGYVSDLANVVAPEEKTQLEELCQQVDQQLGAQFAILTVQNIGDRPIRDFGLDVGRKWGVGSKSTNQGLLILLVVGQHQNDIEVGRGLEPYVTDGFAGSVRRAMAPDLRAGQFGAALLGAAQTLAQHIAEGKNTTFTFSGAQPPRQRSSRRDSGLPGWLIVLGIFFVFWLMGRGRGGRRGGGGGVGNFATGMLIGDLLSGGRRGGGWSDGGGGFGGDSGGGGGFGGFGGGDFGGGGASGDW